MERTNNDTKPMSKKLRLILSSTFKDRGMQGSEKMGYHLLRGIMKDFQTQTSLQTMAQTMAELNNQNHRNNKPKRQKGAWVVQLVAR